MVGKVLKVLLGKVAVTDKVKVLGRKILKALDKVWLLGKRGLRRAEVLGTTIRGTAVPRDRQDTLRGHPLRQLD